MKWVVKFVKGCLFMECTKLLSCFMCMCGFSVGAIPPRVFVNHSIYKGKAALTITPRPPEFFLLDVSITVFHKRLLFHDN